MTTGGDLAQASLGQRGQVPLPVSLILIGLSYTAACVMAFAGVPVVRTADLPLLTFLTAALVALRVVAARVEHPERWALALFWVNLVIVGAAIWLSPAFGLYLFLGYYESGQLEGRARQATGILGTAIVIAVAQVGGPRSVLFTPLVYGGFLAINLLATGLMTVLERRREALYRELALTNAD
ncbi:MAG: hypothetical protein Q4G64_10125, partial [bacterium]|nr:hypothetical protein [bacterium]